MSSPTLILEPLRADDPHHRQTYRSALAAVWPDFAVSDAEFQSELRLAGTYRMYVVRHAGAEQPAAPGHAVGVLHVERVRWNTDDAPPLAMPGLVEGVRSISGYRRLLRCAARFAQEHGFRHLRVLVWDHERELRELVDSLAGWQVGERDFDSSLALDRASGYDHTLPVGVAIATRDERPDLDQSAYECLVKASIDIPGDAATTFPGIDLWLAERNGPTMRDDATFLAIDSGGNVIGYAELEFRELLDGVVWNGFTAVHPDHRGRGIARALKARTIDYARAAGFRELRTENEERNEAMRHINLSLGYVPVAERVIVSGPVASLHRDAAQGQQA